MDQMAPHIDLDLSIHAQTTSSNDERLTRIGVIGLGRMDGSARRRFAAMDGRLASVSCAGATWAEHGGPES